MGSICVYNKIMKLLHRQFRPPPLLKRWGFNFFKIDGNRGEGLKILIFTRKEGLRQNGEGFVQKCGICCIEVFLEIAHHAAQGKIIDLFIFPLFKNMCYKIIAYIKYEMIGTVIPLLSMQITKILLDIFIFRSCNVNKHVL